MKVIIDISCVQFTMRQCHESRKRREQPRLGLKTVSFSRETQECPAELSARMSRAHNLGGCHFWETYVAVDTSKNLSRFVERGFGQCGGT